MIKRATVSEPAAATAAAGGGYHLSWCPFVPEVSPPADPSSEQPKQTEQDADADASFHSSDPGDSASLIGRSMGESESESTTAEQMATMLAIVHGQQVADQSDNVIPMDAGAGKTGQNGRHESQPGLNLPSSNSESDVVFCTCRRMGSGDGAEMPGPPACVGLKFAFLPMVGGG